MALFSLASRSDFCANILSLILECVGTAAEIVAAAIVNKKEKNALERENLLLVCLGLGSLESGPTSPSVSE